MKALKYNSSRFESYTRQIFLITKKIELMKISKYFKIKKFYNLDSLPSEGRIEVTDGGFYELPKWFDQLNQVKPNFPNPSLYDDEDDREVDRYQRDTEKATKGLVELRPLARKGAVGGGEKIKSLPSRIWVTEESFSQLPKEARLEIFSFTQEVISEKEEKERKEEERKEEEEKERAKELSKKERYASLRAAVQDAFPGSVVKEGWGDYQFSIEMEGVKVDNLIIYPSSSIESLIEQVNIRFDQEKKRMEKKAAAEKAAADFRNKLINSGRVAAVYNSSGEVVQYYELKGRDLHVHQDAMGHLIGSRGATIQRAQKRLGKRINLKPTLSGDLPRKASFKWI